MKLNFEINSVNYKQQTSQGSVQTSCFEPLQLMAMIINLI